MNSKTLMQEQYRIDEPKSKELNLSGITTRIFTEVFVSVNDKGMKDLIQKGFTFEFNYDDDKNILVEAYLQTGKHLVYEISFKYLDTHPEIFVVFSTIKKYDGNDSYYTDTVSDIMKYNDRSILYSSMTKFFNAVFRNITKLIVNDIIKTY